LIRVTFGDPVATSLKTSFQEWSPLRPVTGGSHPECRDQNPVPYHLANPQYFIRRLMLINVRTCFYSTAALVPCHDKISPKFFATPPQLGSHKLVRASGLATRHWRVSHLANPQWLPAIQEVILREKHIQFNLTVALVYARQKTLRLRG
jgi:hypothetical protein